MIELKVDLGTRSYPILIGDGLLGTPDLLVPYIGGRQVAVITNTTVGPLYLDKLRASLGGVATDVIELLTGNASRPSTPTPASSTGSWPGGTTAPPP